MKAPLSAAVATLAAIASFVAFAAGVIVLVRVVSPGPARLLVESSRAFECAGLGYVVVGGRDWDRNGTLTDDEAETMGVVCAVNGQLEAPSEEDELEGALDENGRPRHHLAVLLGFEDRGSGPVCASGGLEVSVGVDRDRNGMLSSGEVTETRLLCSPPSHTTPRPSNIATLVLPE